MSKQQINKKILFTGGGTGGSVTPLLAIAEQLQVLSARNPDLKFDFFWLGTAKGPEKEMVKGFNIEFRSILAGKWRRYFSWRNFLDPFIIILAFVQSFYYFYCFKPDIVLSAGSFVSVPVVWAAWFWRIPVLIHQQDVQPGLANKLMAPIAKKITVTFKKSLIDFGPKAVWTGNPLRPSLRQLPDRHKICKKFGLSPDQPIILIVGGGTGSLAINRLTAESLKQLIGLGQIVHLTGKNKSLINKPVKNYYSFEFLPPADVLAILSLAQVVVSRCGLGLLTELSFFAKAAVLIPIPNSHQEQNAQVFARAKAALVLEQKKLTAQKFVQHIKYLLENKEARLKLEENIKKVMKPDAEKEISRIILKILYPDLQFKVET